MAVALPRVTCIYRVNDVALLIESKAAVTHAFLSLLQAITSRASLARQGARPHRSGDDANRGRGAGITLRADGAGRTNGANGALRAGRATLTAGSGGALCASVALRPLRADRAGSSLVASETPSTGVADEDLDAGNPAGRLRGSLACEHLICNVGGCVP
jgi:hypothetical protein